MNEFMLDEQARQMQDTVREFVKNEIDPEYLRRMDRDEIHYPRELYESYARHRLLGLRFPKKYGGQGLNWVADCAAMGEIGALGMAAGCSFVMPSIVGAEGADFFLAYVRTNLADDAPAHMRISAMIIDRSPGVEVKYLYGLLGTRGGGTGRVVFRDVKVPKANLIGPLHGGALVFNTMMIPERLCSAAPCPGGMQACLDVAMNYADRRKAFGQPIRKFQGVSFMIAKAQTLLDVSRAMVYQAARAADVQADNVRRIVSETKKFVTESAWDVANLAMQITGGIGYTDVYPIERAVRDTRLAQIWTGTNEVMSAMIQHDLYQEFRARRGRYRDVEKDAMHADESEKIFDDDDMWRVYDSQK
jgi:alkylation response protein AidB-like acyl-CoA dehydrogenase